MGHSKGFQGLNRTVQAAAEAHRAQGVPAEVLEHAVRRTLAALGSEAPRPGIERRARAYFDAVVRRRLVRNHAGTAAAARIVVESVVDDLVRSGRSGSEVWDEISRGWLDGMPHELAEEYRQRLCA